MKHFWLQALALAGLIFAGFWVSTHPDVLNGTLRQASPRNQTPGTNNPQRKLILTSESGLTKANVTAEVADTPDKRYLGLGGRVKLDPDAGMLFLFDKAGPHQFYMKGMKIPLDFIWIRGDTVVGASENATPPTGVAGEVLTIYSPPVDIDKVLEVNAGFVKFYHITTGDKLKLLP